MTVLMLVFGAVLGLCLGSFANVLIYRLPRELPFAKDRSKCCGCGKAIPAQDLIPVVSYVLLRGKCRFCGMKISARYPWVELAGGALGTLAVWRFGYGAEGWLYLLFFIVLLTVAVIDGEHMIIPDGLIVALLVLAVPLAALAWQDIPWHGRLAGVFVLSLPMLLTNFIVKDAFGGGDIKLMAVCGLLLGLGPTLVAGFIGVLTAGGRASVLVFSGKPYKNRHMPFGPYLCFGVLAACLYGKALVRWYWGFL